MDPIVDDILMHYGVKRRSGRYPWGSGENPYQHGGDFLTRVEELEALGKSQKEIAEELKMSTTDLRMQVRVAKHERRALQAERAKSLREEGKTLDEIAKIMGYNNDSSVRALLNENTASNKNKALATAEALKKELAVKGALDVSKTISVSKQYVRNPDGSLELTRPKTENSVRLVSIPQTAVELLIQEHDKHPDSPYLFPSPITGELYHPDSVVNLHKKILKDAGLPHIRFHDLRHTFATTALQNGVDVKTVSSMLGHYDAGFTLRTYTHATRQKQDEAAATMGSFMEQVM